MQKYHNNLLGATVYPVEKYIFFYGGIFSQWYYSRFVFSFDGLRTFIADTAEQAMMLGKAHVFGDEETFAKILESRNPREQKALGRTVKNYDQAIWDQIKFDFVTYVNYQKFLQKNDLLHLLLLCYPYHIVEASPTDRIWGIGYWENDPDILDKRNDWGKNLLGEAIMKASHIAFDFDYKIETVTINDKPFQVFK